MVAEVVKNKPIPRMKRNGASPKYPWLQMKPGDAFRFDSGVTFGSARSMASQHQAGETAKWKFAVRQCDDGIYCWRIDGTAHELQNGNSSQEAPRIDGYDPKMAASKESLIVDGLEKDVI